MPDSPTTEDDILPCPFCGGEAKVEYVGPSREQIQHAIAWAHDYDAAYYVQCSKCQVTTDQASEPQHVIDYWNRRTL